MANTKTQVMEFKRGDRFAVNYRLRDYNNEAALALIPQIAEAETTLETAQNADPLVPQDVTDAETALTSLQDAYELAVRVDITGWVIRAQARCQGKLIQEFTVTITNESAGDFKLEALDTTQWPSATLRTDIEFDRPGLGKVSSRTFEIDVERDETYD